MIQTVTIDDVLLQELQATLHGDIPLTRAMGVRVLGCNEQGLTLSAPLSPNINHAASAFGGSLASLATLSCWSMLWLQLQLRDLQARILVQESSITYVRPVTRDFVARCRFPEDAAIDRLMTMYHSQGRGRIEMQSEILEDSHPCVGFSGRFVLLPA